MIQVRFVNDDASRKAFVDFLYKKYQHQHNWVLPLRSDELARFDPENNPFLEHSSLELVIAERNDEVVGRVAIIDNGLHNKIHHDNVLFFGFFETDSQETTHDLMDAVEKRARQLGRGRIRGPVNPSMHEAAGFQINAFDTQPYLMTSQNPESYPTFLETEGYTKIKDLLAWRLSSNTAATQAAVEPLEYRVRTLDMKSYEQEFERLLAFYNENRNERNERWGQIPYGDAQAKTLAQGLKDLINPKLVLFLEVQNDLAVVALGLPNENQVLSKLTNAKVFPWGWRHLLLKKRSIDSLRFSLLDVSAKYKGQGLEAILLKEAYARASEQRYTSLEFSYLLEDDTLMNEALSALGAEQYKTFRLFQKELISKPSRPS